MSTSSMAASSSPTSGRHKTLFLTAHGRRHQEAAQAAAPPDLDVVVRRNPPDDELRALLPDTEFLISERAGVIDAGLLAAAPRLRLIQRLGRQTADIDLAAARARGVPVCCLPLPGCVLVAEHMLLQILGVMKRVRELMKITEDGADWGMVPQRGDEDRFAYNWSQRRGIGMLSGATAGILGFGEIGFELSLRLRSFGCRVLYHKRRRLPARAEEEYGVAYATPTKLAAQCDIVCALLPYQGPQPPIDASFFAQMRRGSYFVHCGSGATVDETALLAALRAGHLSGAALDTFTYEPLRPDDPLLEAVRDPLCNLILTPHVAGGAGAACHVQDYDNILAHLHGCPLEHQVA